MIRDVADFRRAGVACRRVRELDIPVEVWRAAMCRVAHQDGGRVRTFLVPPAGIEGDARLCGRLVFAVRVDPPPDRVAVQGGHVRWWRVAEPSMPLGRWRAALHCTARRENARIHTFLDSPLARTAAPPAARTRTQRTSWCTSSGSMRSRSCPLPRCRHRRSEQCVR
jgi:hypothetical protein